MPLRLVVPSLALLPSYCDALSEGDFTTMQLGHGDADRAAIEADPQAYIETITNPAPFAVARNGHCYEVTEHDLLWIVDDTNRFLGTVALRYAGSAELLELYAGHVGLAIRPALLGKGYGVRALAQLARDVRARFEARNIRSVIATCSAANTASARLMEHAGFKHETDFDDVVFGGRAKRFQLSL